MADPLSRLILHAKQPLPPGSSCMRQDYRLPREALNRRIKGRQIMVREYSLVPRAVPRIETPFRRIVRDLPVPESLPVVERLHACEPIAMRGQPPIVWHRAEGFQVFDAWGNQWVDWSAGVLIANAGHGRQEIVDAIAAQASARL